jgi:hypothetical protein
MKFNKRHLGLFTPLLCKNDYPENAGVSKLTILKKKGWGNSLLKTVDFV